MKMQSAVVEQFDGTLALRQLNIPSPQVDQVLIKTDAFGVCHTDHHANRGNWPLRPATPFIPGREAIGQVIELGVDVSNMKIGDRVGIPCLYSACDHRGFWLNAKKTLCPDADIGGHTENGGLVEYIIADPNYVAHMPDGLSTSQAAPIICAGGVTTYKAVKETGANYGEWIAISGCGGLGHLAIQYAKPLGLMVCAVDVDDGKLDHAAQVGADAVINANTGDAATAVKEATNGGAHGVLITAPSLTAFREGVDMTRKLGTCVLLGLPASEFPTPLFDVVSNSITIRGSFVVNRKDMVEALAFAAEGKVKANLTLQPIVSINEIFKRLERGEIPSRVVIDLTN